MADKIFRNGKLMYDAIQNAKYTNNDPVIYSEQYTTEITISDWQNVKLTDKIAIETAATESDFFAVN